jgi:hypothetical protein
MAGKISTPVTSGFFGTKFKPDLALANAANTVAKLNYVDVGGDEDSLFKAAAASMIDNVLSLRTKPNRELTKKLLELHAIYFEQKTIPMGLMTSTEQLAKCLEAPYARARFLNELAFVLRQETVTEIVHNPKRYHKAIFADGKPLSPEMMRQQSTRLNPCALEALSNVMQVPVELYEVEGNKKAAKHTPPTAEVCQSEFSPIVLQLQANHYLALLNKFEFFSVVNRQTVEPLKPKIVSRVKDPELNVMLAAISFQEQQIFQEYEMIVKRLSKMLQAGELSKEKLLNIYIKSVPCIDEPRQTNYAGIEFGSQQWFEEMKASRNTVQPIQLSVVSHDEQITNGLIEALARGISTQKMDDTLIYEMEEKSSKSCLKSM